MKELTEIARELEAGVKPKRKIYMISIIHPILSITIKFIIT